MKVTKTVVENMFKAAWISIIYHRYSHLHKEVDTEHMRLAVCDEQRSFTRMKHLFPEIFIL